MTLAVQSPLAARAAAGLPGASVDVPAPDLQQALIHLRNLRGPEGSFTELRRKTATGMQSVFLTNPQHAAELAVATGAQTDVYVGVLPRAERRGGKDALLPGAGWLWAECDTEAAVARALNLSEPPLLVIRSSRGKAHCYWPLRGNLIPWAHVEVGNRRLAWHLGADLRACDAARILRVAGTRNHKYPDAPRVSITRYEIQSNVWPNTLVGHLPDPAPPRPLPAAKVAPRRDFGPDADKDWLLSIPSRVYVERLTGREVFHNMARCPFHGGGNERSPSFHVGGPQDSLWHCFACDEGGDVVSLAAKLWGLDATRDFPDLKRRLLEALG